MFTEKRVNKFRAAGRIVSLYVTGAGEAGLTLYVRRGRYADFPRIACEKRLIIGFENNMHVCIEGHVEEFLRNINGTFYRERTFVADRMTRENTFCGDEFDSEGQYYPDDYFLLSLSGIVTEADAVPVENGRWLHYKVDVGENDRHFVIPMSLFVRGNMKTPSVYEGDLAGFVCRASTTEKTGKDGKTSRYTDIMVHDLTVIDSSGRKKDHVDSDAEPVKAEKNPAPKKEKKNVSVVLRKENTDRQTGDTDEKNDSDVADLMNDLPDWAKE